MTNEQRMHELLCAYALGEADAAQRIEVERALAASAELRAELEKIEQTIGLVRETLGEGEALSSEAEKALLSAVNPEPRKSAWYSSSWMRMAASFLVIGGGALWMNMLYERNEANLPAGSVSELRDNEKRVGEPQPVARAEEESLLVAELDAKDKAAAEWTGRFTLNGGGALQPLPQEQAQSPYPNNNNIALDSAEIYTWRDTSTVAKNPAEPPPAALDRVSIAQAGDEKLVAQSGYTAPGLGGGGSKGTYRGTGDTVPSGGAAGPSSGGLTGPAPSTAATPKSKPYAEGEAGRLAGKRMPADLDEEAKNRLSKEARLKAEDSRKEVPPPQAGSDTFFLGASAQAKKDQAPAPADEAQARLRQLLDRSDRAASERMAQLNGTPLDGAGYGAFAARDDEADLRQLYYKLTPEQRSQLLEQECRRVFDGCRRLPNENPRDMYFRYWGDNPFEFAALDPLSTFAADVDTASYTLARRYLVEGRLPGKAQIRTEEFVNYFKADVPAPTKGTFAIHTDLAPSRFAQPANSTWMLRVVVRGQELAKEERKPLHLTCVIDCSGSMREQNRMGTVKDTLRLLLTQLNAADMVGIVAFSSEARQILPLTSVANRGLFEVAIEQLAPDGWTNSEAGLKLGYETALAGLDAHATNRVVFLSDGVANMGVTDPTQLSERLKPIRERGVYLNTIGVGMNNHNDTLLEQLADKGDGMCSYVDDMSEAKRVMLDNFMGSLETIARDVKIQVDFDPAQVMRYRLLGYENRAVADADFRNDKVDAGEIGAGHQVTALYELERNLAVTGEKPLATVRLRYKAPRLVNGPANEEAREIAQEVRGSQQTSFEGADAGYRRAVIVGQFAEFLRRSVHARGRSLDDLLVEAHKLEAQLPQDTEFREFVALAEKSKELVLRNLPNCDELCQAIDAYRTWQFQCAQAERLSHERQQQIVEDLARQNREMEERIRELLRHRLEGSPK